MHGADADETIEAVTLAWCADFARSDEWLALDSSVRDALEGAVRVVARSFRRRDHVLTEMTADDIVDIFTVSLPRRLYAIDPGPIIDGLCALFIWAAKTNRIKDRQVEYACRKIRGAAMAAMKDERNWAPGTSMLASALCDGVDVSDLARLREHAIRRGYEPAFVDEFLPPEPAWLGGNRWLWLR